MYAAKMRSDIFVVGLINKIHEMLYSVTNVSGLKECNTTRPTFLQIQNIDSKRLLTSTSATTDSFGSDNAYSAVAAMVSGEILN